MTGQTRAWPLPRGDGRAGGRGRAFGAQRVAADILFASKLMSPSPITHLRQVLAGLSWRGGPVWVTTTVLGIAIALAACHDATGPLAEAGPPDDLEFSIGGFAVGESTVELRGDTVVLRRTRPEVIDTVRAVPTPDSWRAFWSATERAGVRRWRARYAAEGIVDGVGWSVRIAVNGRLVESSGDNAYPDRFGREHELGMTDDFRTFLTAVGELVGHPVWF
jgi:hypothetical protein